MGKLRWYKRDPEAALNGMAELSLAERGAYNTLIDLLYTRDGLVPDDDVLVARMMRCHWREWRTIKKQLIALHKVRVIDGRLMANRVTETLDEASKYAQDHGKEPARLPQEPVKNAAGLFQESKSPNEINGPKNTTTTTVTTIAERGGRRGVRAGASDVELDLEISIELAAIAGHPTDPKIWPGGWCGTPHQVRKWFNEGYSREEILLGAREAMGKKRDGPPYTANFFDNQIARTAARMRRPVPNVVEIPAATVEVHHGQYRNGYGQGANAGKSHSAFALDYARRAAGTDRPGGG
jgi:uncharacterized protein YdaU (DUF1376 family)